MAYIQYGRSILRRVAQDNSVSKSDGLLHPLIFTGQGVRYRTLEVILTTVCWHKNPKELYWLWFSEKSWINIYFYKLM